MIKSMMSSVKYTLVGCLIGTAIITPINMLVAIIGYLKNTEKSE